IIYLKVLSKRWLLSFNPINSLSRKLSDSQPYELIHAEELMYDGKVEEALEIIINFEKMFANFRKVL
ncbi:MAG: hypothetical protein ACXACB_05975, partial [Promethearchaeota archaeon]